MLGSGNSQTEKTSKRQREEKPKKPASLKWAIKSAYSNSPGNHSCKRVGTAEAGLGGNLGVRV